MPPAEPRVSIILPVYNEQGNLAELLEEIGHAFANGLHEVLAVDDASTDGSLAELHRLATDCPALRVLTLERHAGQSAALAAGFEAARAPVVVTLDADGQNDPADAPGLVARLVADPGCAAVVGYRVRRQDSGWKRLQSRTANAIRDWVTGDRVRDTGCGLKVMRRDALVRLPRFAGMHRFLPTLIRMQGGTVIEAPVGHRPRRHGVTKYGAANRAWRGLRDALGVRWLRRRALRYQAREEHSQP